MCDCANRTFFALRCYQSKLSPAIIKVFVHILKFSPAKKHKITFLFSRFSLTKSAAKVSKEDSRRPPLRTSVRRARVSRTRRAWRVRAAKDRAKIGSFALPATSYYEHSARKSRADSCTHCLHAIPKQEPMLSFLHKYAKAQSTFALSA